MTNVVEAPRTPGAFSTERAGVLYHASPARNLASIQARGLLPARSSRRLKEDVVHLTSQLGMAIRYAEQGFGTNGAEAWIILAVDTAALDPIMLRPDWECEEAARCFDDLIAHGYSSAQVHLGDYPWSLGLQVFGMAMYADAIAPTALRIVDGPRLF
jgi:hypothetical protein